MKKLLYFVSEDWYFVSHRLNLALAAQRDGFEVVVVTRCRTHFDMLVDLGFVVIPFETKRRGINPVGLLKEAITLASIYRKIKPTIVHHVALRSVVVGAIAAHLSGIKRVVSAITGMGFFFVDGEKIPFTRRILQWICPRLLASSAIIVQNADDRALLLNIDLPSENVRLIPGAGVDEAIYIPSLQKRNDQKIVVLMAARLVWDKGVGEFVEAARAIRDGRVKFVLVGRFDEASPVAVTSADLENWVSEGVVEYWGYRDDMYNVLPKADIVCLPSYREGFPKILLEAMSCGLPCITTDVPGCREAVRDGDNGLIVPVRDSGALVGAICKLLDDPIMRLSMGRRGRERVLAEFAEGHIIQATLHLYHDLLS